MCASHPLPAARGEGLEYAAPGAGELTPPAGGAVDTALTQQVRALYEDTVVPVREIARLAGVTERTVYKYARKRGWRARVVRLARGAGGRFVTGAEEGGAHACGLKALDPAAEAIAAARCGAAGAMAEAAMAQAKGEAQARSARACVARAKSLRDKEARAAQRRLELLAGALVELARQRVERPAGTIPAADRLDVALQRAILAHIDALVAPRNKAGASIKAGR